MVSNLTNTTNSSLNVRQYKHVIVHDETLQQIAANYLNDVTQWSTIATYNNLKYPYIVDSAEDKLANVSHLVCPGDTIIIPANVSLDDIEPSTLSGRDQNTIEQMALGTDLAIDYQDSELSYLGTYDGVVDLTANGVGDLKLAVGSRNLKQALIMRLSTRKGTLALHTNYGSLLSTMIGQPAETKLTATKNVIQQALESDSRVASVTCNNISVTGNEVTSSWTVVPEGLSTSWNFVVQGDLTGNFTLTG